MIKYCKIALITILGFISFYFPIIWIAALGFLSALTLLGLEARGIMNED